MLISDFEKYGIKNFTPDEVTLTGSELRDVNVFLMAGLQDFRTHPNVDRAVLLLYGGLTTGNHSSWQHPNGTAGDVAFREGDGPIVIKRLVYAAVDVGFRGIGVYWNGSAWSMHLDLGPEIRRWAWWKRHHDENWHKEDLIFDVSTF